MKDKIIKDYADRLQAFYCRSFDSDKRYTLFLRRGWAFYIGTPASNFADSVPCGVYSCKTLSEARKALSVSFQY